MNNLSINNLSFKANIKIVSPADYNLADWKLSRNNNVEEIYRWMLNPKLIDKLEHNCYRANAEVVNTKGIRSCVAGVFSDKDKSESLVMHIYDSKDNFERLSTLNPHIKGKSGFLIGSREEYPESKKIFKYIEEQAKSKNITTTIMENFNDMWEASFIYLAKKNEIILCIKDILNPKRYVKNKDELMKAFKRVVISPNDTIEFISSKIAKAVSLK